jgi:A/G-specific adenine glycosylase
LLILPWNQLVNNREVGFWIWESSLYMSELSKSLLAWYDRIGRDLPWRVKGARAEAYHVWLSEIMLQQTTVAAVKEYFLKFVALWPTVQDLAAADLDDVLRAWAGLGYYARARNLHKCAGVIVAQHGGNFPSDYASLLALPGVGPYTVGAISAIAFDLPLAAVDGNVERVLSRFYAIEQPLPLSKPDIKAKAQALVPKRRAGDFAQAMMDLGATVCTPKSPNCAICPWTEDCVGRQQNIAATLPRKLTKAKVPTRRGFAYWLERSDGAVLLQRRPEQGLLGGMMEIPSCVWEADAERNDLSDQPLPAAWQELNGVVRHTFTHFHLELVVLKAVVAKTTKVSPPQKFVQKAHLRYEALPTVMRKIVAHVLGEG